MNPSLLINSGDLPSPVNDRIGPSINNIFRIAPQVSAAFITKLYRILGIEESQYLISWTPSGTQFCVHDMHKFSKDILPQYFKHNNWPSFVRQLNMYGFHKVSEVSGPHSKPLTGHDSNVVYKFRHADFQRNRQDLLHRIRRKKPRTSHQTAFHYTNGFDLVRQQRQDSPEISSECFGLKNGDEGISVSIDLIYHIDETLERLKRKADTAQIEIDDLRKSVFLQQNLLERFLNAMNSNTESSAKDDMLYVIKQLKAQAQGLCGSENESKELLGYSSEQGHLISQSLMAKGRALNSKSRLHDIQSICNLPTTTRP